MQIFVPRETEARETRVPIIPQTVRKFVQLGAQVEVESDLGLSIRCGDDEYEAAGASISRDRDRSLSSADLILRLNKPPVSDVRLLKPGAIHIGYLDPFVDHELIRALAESGVSAVSIEMIPRTTIAQKMDALSSQANLTGYVAVVIAAERLDRIFPMMTTPAGTIAPTRVLVIGAGVAGLQAIATAHRLGARVDAFDTRPEVEEQVRSLGARFIKIELGETGQTEHGYAKALEEEQLMKQREALARHCSLADVVIARAQVFGKKPPLIVTREMVMGMKPGSLVLDLAAETGGNVEGSKLDEEVVVNGVTVLGTGRLPARVPVPASQMYSNNLGNFVEHFWNRESKSFELRMDDEILRGSLVTHDHRICNETLKELIEVRQ